MQTHIHDHTHVHLHTHTYIQNYKLPTSMKYKIKYQSILCIQTDNATSENTNDLKEQEKSRKQTNVIIAFGIVGAVLSFLTFVWTLVVMDLHRSNTIHYITIYYFIHVLAYIIILSILISLSIMFGKSKSTIDKLVWLEHTDCCHCC